VKEIKSSNIKESIVNVAVMMQFTEFVNCELQSIKEKILWGLVKKT